MWADKQKMMVPPSLQTFTLAKKIDYCFWLWFGFFVGFKYANTSLVVSLNYGQDAEATS